MYTFYNNSGSKIENSQEFLKYYSYRYSKLYPDLKTEEKIKQLLCPDHTELSTEDIQEILCWKIPATKKPNSTKVIITRFPSRIIDAYEIKKCIPSTKHVTDNAVIDLLTKLTSIKYIGPVYAITILYFVTHGEFPIYDRFAHIALKKICENTAFHDLISQKYLDNEFHKTRTVKTWYNEYKNNYIQRLKDIFGDEYISNREIDRALWTYGHLFNDTKANKSRNR